MGSIFLKVPSSGKNEEGFGAIMQDVLAYYATSKALGIKILFDGLKDLQHYQYYNVTQEDFCQDFNSLFRSMKSELPQRDSRELKFENFDQNFVEFIQKFNRDENDLIVSLNHASVINFFRTNIHVMEKNDIFKEVRQSLFIPETEKYFKKETVNIAVHIRKFTQTDVDSNSSREYYDKGKDRYYIELIEKIGKLIGDHKQKEFHIFSQGSEEDFMFMRNSSENVIFHIEEYPPTTMYHLCKSDILVMANSSFSYAAGLIGNQILFCRPNFWHPTFTDKKVIVDGSNLFSEIDFLSKMKKYLS